MADIVSKQKRSEMMSLIRSKDTKPEITVRKILHRLGYRFRLHRKDLPGQPDIVLRKYKTVIFVHGCFWHGHSCKKGKTLPKTNESFWQNKIKGNQARDNKVLQELTLLGWHPCIIWECEVRNDTRLVERILECLKHSENTNT